MSIPDTPQSNVENYLGSIIAQASAQLPEVPQSRIEEYLAYIAANGKGIELAACDNPEIRFKLLVDSDGKLITERIS